MLSVKEIYNEMHNGCTVLVNWKDGDKKMWFNTRVQLLKKGTNEHATHKVVLFEGDGDQVYKLRIVHGDNVGIRAVVPGSLLPSTEPPPRPSRMSVDNIVLIPGSKIRVMNPAFQPGEKIIGIYSAVILQIRHNKIKARFLKDEFQHFFEWFERRHVMGMMKEGCENDVKKVYNPSYVSPVVVPPVVAVVVPPVVAVVVSPRKSSRTPTPTQRLVEEY